MYDNVIETTCDGDFPCRDRLRSVIQLGHLEYLAEQRAQKEKDAVGAASFSKVVNE